MTMLQREAEERAPKWAFTEAEMRLLDRLVKPRGGSDTLSDYVLKLACLGGYLARASDPPPGKLVMWRGFSRLNDIQLGFSIASENCG